MLSSGEDLIGGELGKFVVKICEAKLFDVSARLDLEKIWAVDRFLRKAHKMTTE